MHRAAKVTLGCLLAPVGLLVIGLLFFAGLRAAGVPESRPGSQSLEQELPRSGPTALETTPPPSAGGGLDLAPGTDVVRVVLELEEGLFDIRSDDGVDRITVEADYDEASYELVQEYGLEEGRPTYRLRFSSKISFLRRIASKGGLHDEDLANNQVSVLLPLGTPLELVIDVSKSETEIDLSGLSITRLVTRMRLGEYHLESREPNPLTLEKWTADVGLGEVTVRGASLLRARVIDLTGGMGEVRLDFGESLALDTEVVARMKMGEMRLRVPDDALWDPDSRTKASLGEVNNLARKSGQIIDPETARRLKLDASVLMGELTVEEFRTASLGSPRRD